MAVEVVHTIGTGGDYATIADWQVAQARDLVTADEIAVAEVLAQDFTRATRDAIRDGDGWVTDATRRIIVRAVAGGEFSGTRRDDGGINARLHYTSSASEGLSVSQSLHATISGLEFSGEIPPLKLNSCAGRIINSFIDATAMTGSGSAINISDGLIRNCVILHNGRGADIRNRNSTIQNCTFISPAGTGGYGPLTDSTSVLQNTVSFNHSTEDIYGVPGTNNTNASGDGSIGATITSAAFVDYAGGDYRPAPGGALDGAGTDLSADFTDDITGATRTQWDIGAFAIISGGGIPTLTAKITGITATSAVPVIDVTF